MTCFFFNSSGVMPYRHSCIPNWLHCFVQFPSQCTLRIALYLRAMACVFFVSSPSPQSSVVSCIIISSDVCISSNDHIRWKHRLRFSDFQLQSLPLIPILGKLFPALVFIIRQVGAWVTLYKKRAYKIENATTPPTQNRFSHRQWQPDDRHLKR